MSGRACLCEVALAFPARDETGEMAQDAYDALGTDPADKSLVLFEESAHQPFAEEPEAFTRAVLDFLELHR